MKRRFTNNAHSLSVSLVSSVSAVSAGAPMTTPLHDQSRLSWKLWNRQLLNDDHQGDWYGFSLTTHLTTPFLIRKLERRCLYVMDKRGLVVPLSDADPLPSRTHVRRNGVVVFLLPATSHAGHEHFHGMARVPKQQAATVMTIYENDAQKQVVVPVDIHRVFQTQFGKGIDATFRNIHLLHDNVCVTMHGAQCVGTAEPLNRQLDIATHRVLRYWQKTDDGELRDFGESVWIPQWVRQALPSADTTRPASVIRRTAIVEKGAR